MRRWSCTHTARTGWGAACFVVLGDMRQRDCDVVALGGTMLFRSGIIECWDFGILLSSQNRTSDIGGRWPRLCATTVEKMEEFRRRDGSWQATQWHQWGKSLFCGLSENRMNFRIAPSELRVLELLWRCRTACGASVFTMLGTGASSVKCGGRAGRYTVWFSRYFEGIWHFKLTDWIGLNEERGARGTILLWRTYCNLGEIGRSDGENESEQCSGTVRIFSCYSKVDYFSLILPIVWSRMQWWGWRKYYTGRRDVEIEYKVFLFSAV